MPCSMPVARLPSAFLFPLLQEYVVRTWELIRAAEKNRRPVKNKPNLKDVLYTELNYYSIRCLTTFHYFYSDMMHS